MTEWWRRTQRIVQTNLRLTDGTLDPERLAADVAAFGATAMLFNVGGIFAWYPTELGLQAKNPMLQGDLLRRMIDAAHRHDIRFIGRYDLSKATRIAYDAHPEWFCRDREGHAFEYNGTYQACVNGGWYHHQGVQVLKESLGRYDIDGLFFNMFGYLSTDYSYRQYGLCHCENCRREFHAFSGEELPQRADVSDRLYRAYLRFQEITSRALSEEICDVVKSVRPGVAVSNMGRRSDFFRGEVNRRLDRPHPEWVHLSGEEARNFRSLGGGHTRYSSALTHFVDFPWRYSAETGAAQALRLAQQLANGADPHYYFMGKLDQADRKPLPAVRAIFDYHRDNEALYGDLESAARVALYTSHKSRRYHPRSGASIAAFRGAYRALVDAGIAFDTIHDLRAGEADFAEAHSRYETIILAGAGCMSQAEATSLDAFVEAGGTLLMIGDAASYDETGEPLPQNRLNSRPFTKVEEVLEEMRGGYVRTSPGTRTLGGLDSDLILLDGPYRRVIPKPGARTLYSVLLPQRFGPPELCYPDPELDTDLPGVLLAGHGKGQAIYIPWNVDMLYHEHGLLEHRALLAQLALKFAPAKISLSAPRRLEMTVQRHRESGDLVVHLVNYSGQNDNCYDEPITIHDMDLLLDLPVVTCRALVAGKALAVETDGNGRQKVRLPPIGYFEAIRIR
ncbi:alpha-amylase family protein [Rhizobium sp. LCM 4573]|uniref:alpha-amylase family protein n=1 Tax=Rhizobium sp. LCM 4573 TaxID=1848291 RepID=UPI0012FF930A|nr:alpha-amylase family protein [Rhizobium sp. LCM 4573]